MRKDTERVVVMAGNKLNKKFSLVINIKIIRLNLILQKKLWKKLPDTISYLISYYKIRVIRKGFSNNRCLLTCTSNAQGPLNRRRIADLPLLGKVFIIWQKLGEPRF